MTLFEECLIALNGKAEPLSIEESAKIEVVLQCLFPFVYANIDWVKIEKKIIVNSIEPDIIVNLKKLLKAPLDESICISWDTNVPVLKTDLYSAIAHFDDVTSVSTRTWLFNLNQGYAIEWHWCGSKVIGLAEKEKIYQASLLKKCLDNLPIEKFYNLQDGHEAQWVRKLLNPFAQPKYWHIKEPYLVDAAINIIPFIETSLKLPIQKDIILIWKNKQFPIIQTDLEKIIPIWDMLVKIKIPFQIIAINSSYRIEVGLENSAIKITVNFGLKPR